MRCASCNPAGTPPRPAATWSPSPNRARSCPNDGRVFFATQESLVPQDTDGIRDIYEYTEGHAQLISSGTGDRESTGGLETVSFFFGNTQTGLESVSRDGTDVYFSTFETLVPEDKNGSFVKIYDARTNGGFDFNPGTRLLRGGGRVPRRRQRAAAAGGDRDRAAASAAAATCRSRRRREQHKKKHHKKTPQEAPPGKQANRHRSQAMADARREKELT